MPSIHFRNPQLSKKLLLNRYQTEYLNKFCNDSEAVLYGHRQFPEHVWLQQRPVGSSSFRVDEVPQGTYLRPPYASRLTYYDEMNDRKITRAPRCHTTQPKKPDKCTQLSRPKSEEGRTIEDSHQRRKQDIDKMTLQKYRETSHENMIGPRVFFHPTIPPQRHDYVIHPAFHSEAKKRPRNVPVRKHPVSGKEKDRKFDIRKNRILPVEK